MVGHTSSLRRKASCLRRSSPGPSTWATSSGRSRTSTPLRGGRRSISCPGSTRSREPRRSSRAARSWPRDRPRLPTTLRRRSASPRRHRQSEGPRHRQPTSRRLQQRSLRQSSPGRHPPQRSAPRRLQSSVLLRRRWPTDRRLLPLSRKLRRLRSRSPCPHLPAENLPRRCWPADHRLPWSRDLLLRSKPRLRRRTGPLRRSNPRARLPPSVRRHPCARRPRVRRLRRRRYCPRPAVPACLRCAACASSAPLLDSRMAFVHVRPCCTQRCRTACCVLQLIECTPCSAEHISPYAKCQRLLRCSMLCLPCNKLRHADDQTPLPRPCSAVTTRGTWRPCRGPASMAWRHSALAQS